MTRALALPTSGMLAHGRALAELVPPFLQWFALVRRRMPNTVRSYEFDLTRFLRFCDEAGLTHPDDVTFRHIEFYLGVLQAKDGLVANSANRHLQALRTFWRWLVREGITTTNPAAETFLLPTARRLPIYLTVPEQEKVLRALAKGRTLRARRDYALVATALFTGLRCSELAHVELAHVDLESGILRVVQGKGSKDREVPLIPRLGSILRGYLAEVRPQLRDSASSAYVFCRVPAQRHNPARGIRPNQPLLGRTIFWRVRQAVSPIVGRPIAPHTLRHSFATRLREHGADLQLIQEALGHASIATTTLYAHLTTSKRRQNLARLLEGPSESKGRRMDVMTPEHPLWTQFALRLFKALGPPSANGCNHRDTGRGHEATLAILSTLDVDVAASLEYLKAHGGSCDCEVIFNVILPELPDEPEEQRS